MQFVVVNNREAGGMKEMSATAAPDGAGRGGLYDVGETVVVVVIYVFLPVYVCVCRAQLSGRLGGSALGKEAVTAITVSGPCRAEGMAGA